MFQQKQKTFEKVDGNRKKPSTENFKEKQQKRKTEKFQKKAFKKSFFSTETKKFFNRKSLRTEIVLLYAMQQYNVN